MIPARREEGKIASRLFDSNTGSYLIAKMDRNVGVCKEEIGKFYKYSNGDVLSVWCHNEPAGFYSRENLSLSLPLR